MSTPRLLALTALVSLLSWGSTCAPAQGLPTAPVFGDPDEQPGGPPPTSTSAGKTVSPPQAPAASTLPWETAFSNLPQSRRSQYAQRLQQAKAAYQRGDTELCLLTLGACDLLFDQNPHAINLQISCLLDLDRLEEIPPLIRRSRELLPVNEVADFSESSLLLAQGQYDACISASQRMLDDPRYRLTSLVRDVLRYRILLSHLAMGRTAQARELVSGLTPLSDTPLYYMSEVAFNLCAGDSAQAEQNMKAARDIFATSGQLAGFVRAFNQSRLTERTPGDPAP